MSLSAVKVVTAFPAKPSLKTSNDALTCSSMAELKQLHSQTVCLGLSADNHAVGKLIKFCATSDGGDFGYALQLFDALPQPDAFVYNTLIGAQTRLSLHLYSLMLTRFVLPNQFTFPSLIRACCFLGVDQGKQVHAHVLKFGFGDDRFCRNGLIHLYFSFRSPEDARKVFDTTTCHDVVTWTTLISGYSRCGLVDEASRLFESMPEKSSVSWNTMIACFVQSHRFDEALALFHQMMKEEKKDVPFDKYLAATMLAACTGLGSLEQGKRIHGFIEENRIEPDSKLASALIDMYCKCGSLDEALRIFNSLSPRLNKWVSPWNSMIGGLAMHGRGEAAVELFHKMEKERVSPDGITFINLLTACAHSGLVGEGRRAFQIMTQVHGIEPGPEHFGGLVDLLGRAGLLNAARKVVDEMPVSPDKKVLGALLGACRIYGHVKLGEEIGWRLIELDPGNSGRYVLLANLYAEAGRSEDAARVRKLMDERGVKKAAGYSRIEFGGVVDEFVAGGRTHPRSREIYAKVDEMLERIRLIGYVPDILEKEEEEEEKERGVCYHSEKLAIAFGLLKMKPGETIRITKNLRVCGDCHIATKLISAAYSCEIIVRDRNRFHHFKTGECSCKDYW